MINTPAELYLFMKNIDCNVMVKDHLLNILFKYSMQTPLPLKNNNVEIRPSKIHGNGVFATQDIPKGCIATFYPAHAVHLDETVIFQEPEKNRDFISKIRSHKYDKLYGMTDNTYGHNFLNIIGNPERHDRLLLGHMINDAVGNVFKDISFADIQNKKNFKNVTSAYYMNSIKNMNCRLVYHFTYPIIYVLTTRHIKKDEELLTTYGPTYWFDENYDKNDQQDDEFKKMMTQICDETYLKWLVPTIQKLCPERFTEPICK
jgi:ABC-type uncharacterized transport system substrate-binding protein